MAGGERFEADATAFENCRLRVDHDPRIIQQGASMSVSRREFLQTGAMVMATANLGAAPQGGAAPPSVKALVFDTFGTVVDWRSSVAREVEALAKRKGVTIDGAKFADAWRAGYGPSMNRVRSGELPWTKLDALHRMTLDKILVELQVRRLERRREGHAESRLAPADAVARRGRRG